MVGCKSTRLGVVPCERLAYLYWKVAEIDIIRGQAKAKSGASNQQQAA